MATLVLQSYQSVSHNEDEDSVANLEKMLLENLGKLTTTSRYWTMFRVGKQATRLVSQSQCCNTVWSILCTNAFLICLGLPALELQTGTFLFNSCPQEINLCSGLRWLTNQCKLATTKSIEADISSVCPLSEQMKVTLKVCSNKGLMQETSALKLFMMANLCY